MEKKKYFIYCLDENNRVFSEYVLSGAGLTPADKKEHADVMVIDLPRPTDLKSSDFSTLNPSIPAIILVTMHDNEKIQEYLNEKRVDSSVLLRIPANIEDYILALKKLLNTN
ncbi:MAG: hypothetical protein NT165_02825 [Candidatus Falkowbacteria bacterium]|nr:hypothetical protein [Candidatus Falkowbacteria bacterium]